MQLKTKKIIALQGLIFLFSTTGWLILILAEGEVEKIGEFLTVVVITSGIINFIIWAIRILLRKKETN